MANRRSVCPLLSDLQNAFSYELANALDEFITGFHFEWNMGNGCFSIREEDGKTHTRIAMNIYIGETRLSISHFSFPNPDGGAQKCQSSGCYDLANPNTTPENMAAIMADMLDRTLPYHRAVDVNHLEEDADADASY